MIAPRDLPPEFARWNGRWHAPFGRWSRLTRLLGPNSGWVIRRRGPFAYQANNDTRRYEYPWAYSRVAAHRAAMGGRPLRIVEIGGSLAGLQWVLARDGHHVTNVDPGLNARGIGWEVSAERHQAISRALGGAVTLIPTTLANAGIPDHSADVLLSVSTIEHFAPVDLAEFCAHAARTLRPDGVAILSIDLFLDLSPFCSATQHRYGTNVDVRRLLADAGLTLREGDPAELYGFPEFSTDQVLQNLSRYLVGQGYPALAQCLVAGVSDP